jgi:periplasmic divalent cation tolerance protein
MTDIVLVLTTVLPDAADRIALALVEERLAACVNALPPMSSTYRWQGGVAQETERQLVIKTVRARFADLRRRLGELHPYELPEFLVIDVDEGSDGYLSWVTESTR